MDRIQWFVVKSNIQVTVTSDLDKVKNLRCDGTVVDAGGSPFLWKVWQASPESDSFL